MVAVKTYIYMNILLYLSVDTINVTQARNDLFRLMDSVLEGRRTTITSKKGNAVLMSEEEWNEIVETLYILSDQDTLPAVTEARATPNSELETMDWKNIF
jgi:prevent-host-death family protein